MTQQIAHPVAQAIETRAGERVDRALRPLALARDLLRHHIAALHQRVDHRVERAIAKLDAFFLVPLLQRRRHFVGVHRPLEQQRQHREREWIGGTTGLRHLIIRDLYIRIRIYVYWLKFKPNMPSQDISINSSRSLPYL